MSHEGLNAARRCGPAHRLTVMSLPVSGLEFDRWLNDCGPPLFEPDLSAADALTQPVQELCALWKGYQMSGLAAISTFDPSAWSTYQNVLFLDQMLDLSPLPHGTAGATPDLIMTPPSSG